MLFRSDVTEITDAMTKLLKNPDVCERYGKASLEVAKKHDLNRTLRRFVEIYQEAIKLKQEKVD